MTPDGLQARPFLRDDTNEPCPFSNTWSYQRFFKRGSPGLILPFPITVPAVSRTCTLLAPSGSATLGSAVRAVGLWSATGVTSPSLTPRRRALYTPCRVPLGLYLRRPYAGGPGRGGGEPRPEDEGASALGAGRRLCLGPVGGDGAGGPRAEEGRDGPRRSRRDRRDQGPGPAREKGLRGPRGGGGGWGREGS